MYEWQNLGIPEVVEIFGYRIEPTPGGWMLVAIPLAMILCAGVLIRVTCGKYVPADKDGHAPD